MSLPILPSATAASAVARRTSARVRARSSAASMAPCSPTGTRRPLFPGINQKRAKVFTLDFMQGREAHSYLREHDPWRHGPRPDEAHSGAPSEQRKVRQRTVPRRRRVWSALRVRRIKSEKGVGTGQIKKRVRGPYLRVFAAARP